METIRTSEGMSIENINLATADAIRRRLTELRHELRPRIAFLSGDEAHPVVQNLIGSVQVSPDLMIEVAPKTSPGADWPTAVLEIMVDEPVSFEAVVEDAALAPRLQLADALARIYATQLEIAIRREGPLSVIVETRTTRSRLRGRLDVTAWTTGRILRPHRFPQTESVLTVDNPYTSAMAWVANALASRARDTETASRLRKAATDLRPGLPPFTVVDPGIAMQTVPAQWRAYLPAWTTVCAVLRRTSPLRRSGALRGLGLAIEPWPLLEKLLVRSVHAAARQAITEGLALVGHGHTTHRLLTPNGLSPGDSPLARLMGRRSVEPDASLTFGDRIVATFEAKYAMPTTPEDIRGHVFQAMTAAGAVGSPLSVLVYPEAAAPVVWDTSGFGGRPERVIAIGLDMYGYRRGTGDTARGELLLGLVRDTALLTPSPAPLQ